MKRFPFMTAALLLCVTQARSAESTERSVGDKFMWSQLQIGAGWDPYPGVHAEILKFVVDTTSVLVIPERRVLSVSDPRLFSSPFLVLAGSDNPPDLDASELGRLRDYLTSGGFLWIEDASGIMDSPFDAWVRRTLTAVLPDADIKPLPKDHVVHKTFFLMRRIGGRVMVSRTLEGVDWAGKTVVVYSRNDILGAWARDALGNPLFACSPGGETQRLEAKKLSLNIVMYALTGSYKADAVHQPFILQKMGAGSP